MAVRHNKSQGAFFEAVLEHAAARQYILAQKQPLAFRYLRGGKVLPIKTELDFSLLNRQGKVVFIDTKSFAGTHFTYSQLNETQLRRAIRYNEWQVSAGFVVHFVGSDDVSYFPGQRIAEGGPRSRFTAATGISLGTLQRIDLLPIFEFLPQPVSLPRLRL